MHKLIALYDCARTSFLVIYFYVNFSEFVKYPDYDIDVL